MTTASICTIGDEILIGQIIDTNSAFIAGKLGENGIRVNRISSIGDDHDTIIRQLSEELSSSDIVISTGGLGPTKDDITKEALAELSGSHGYVLHEGQMEMVRRILHSRGLDMLESNRRQALVPDSCEVIVNRRGTAPIMIFRFPESRFGHPAVLYSMPGVPFETKAALQDVLDDIKTHFHTEDICHRNIMVYGLAESALSEKIADWEDNLPEYMHLAYLPNPLTGIRLRLSIYGGRDRAAEEAETERQLSLLRPILGDYIYAEEDSCIEAAIGRLLRGNGRTVSAAESCTGGMISHLITTVPGSSEYYLGAVTSYAVSVKNKVLGVPLETVEKYGIVSAEVAAAMAEGVRRLTGSTYSVSTTGWADSYGDEREPAGTVWVGISGPTGTVTARFNYKNDRKRNIDRFAASALNELRKYIEKDINC